MRTSRIAVCILALTCVRSAHAQADESPKLIAPEVVEAVKAVYPADALTQHHEADVVVLATVELDGRVTEAEIAESGGASFDAAALDAIRKWKFKPALRDGVPFRASVRVPFRFTLSSHAASEPKPDASAKPGTAPSTGHDHAPSHVNTDAHAERHEEDEHADARFEATLRSKPSARATSDFVIERAVLAAAPHQSAADLLATAPGIYIARPEGDAVAHQVYLRGFDAEHGQDIEFTVGPVPVNSPGHIHGQGYADLNFIIPEVVRSLHVTEGVYDPRQGDFAVAGSVEFDLGVAHRGFLSHSAYGSFNTFRQLVLWAPRGQAEETFAAVTIRRSDGFGQNRASLSGGAIGQYAFGKGNVKGVAHVSAYGARAGLAGVLRLDDVNAGRVRYYDSYPDPSANAQSALATRAQASVSIEHRSDAGARTLFSTWFVYSGFRQRANFTGYTQRSMINPEWVGRGDLIEQENRDIGLGARVSHRTRRYQPTKWLSGTFEAGFMFKQDLVDQAQNLLQQPQNETWDKRVDASVRASDIGLYVDADWRATKYFHLRGGIRADVLYYDVDDRLGNFIPSFMRQSHLVGFRRTALGVAWGPRVAAEAIPTKWLTLMVSYGEGFRSPQPRLLEEGENAPFAKVRSLEGGARIKVLKDRLQLTAAGYATWLSTDLAFDPGEARLEKIGPTQRAGVAAYLLAHPWPWALISVSVTYVHATLQAPPPATATNPTPAFTPGQLLPYVPPIVLRADLGVDKEFTQVRKHTLSGKVGVGFTYLSSRPLPYGQSAAPVALLDASTSLRWWFLELGVEAFNLIGSRYAAVEYSFVSDWGTRAVPSALPARHLSAGAPRTVMSTLGLHF